MSCGECGGIEQVFNDKVGETECADCGLILVTEMFEETVSAYDYDGNQLRSSDWVNLGSRSRSPLVDTDRRLRVAINICNMTLASFATTKHLRERIEKLYLSAYRKNLFATSTYEERATALVYYVLRENDMPFTLKEIAFEAGVNSKRAFTLVRALSLEFGSIKSSVRSIRNFAEKYAEIIQGDGKFIENCGRLAEHLIGLSSEMNENLTPSSSAAIVWIVSKAHYKTITQKTIAEVSGVTTRTIYEETKRLMKIMNKNMDEIIGKGIEGLL